LYTLPTLTFCGGSGKGGGGYSSSGAPFTIVESKAISQTAISGIVAGVFILTAAVVAWISKKNKVLLSKPEFHFTEINVCGRSVQSSSDADNVVVADPENIHLRHIFRPAGFIMLVLSIIELCIGLAVYSFWEFFPKVGAFWAASLAIPAGYCAYRAKSRSYITAACVLASLSIVVAGAGAATDCIATAIWTDPVVCGQAGGSSKYTVYGDTNDVTIMFVMAFIYGFGAAPTNPNVCFCIIKKSGGTAYTLANPGSTTCENVRNSWMPSLAASSAMCILICVLSFILAVAACVDLCRKPANNEITVIQTVGYPTSPGYYPQQQPPYPQHQHQQYHQQQYAQNFAPAYDQTYSGGRDKEIGQGSEIQLTAFRNSEGNRNSSGNRGSEGNHRGGYPGDSPMGNMPPGSHSHPQMQQPYPQQYATRPVSGSGSSGNSPYGGSNRRI